MVNGGQGMGRLETFGPTVVLDTRGQLLYTFASSLG